MIGPRERVLEVGGAEVSKQGWTVATAYWTGTQVKWGTFSHSQKARALAVYRNLEKGAHEIRCYRRGVLFMNRKPERVTVILSGADAAAFFEE